MISNYNCNHNPIHNYIYNYSYSCSRNYKYTRCGGDGNKERK